MRKRKDRIVNNMVSRISLITLVSIMVARDHQYIKLIDSLNQDLEHNQENSMKKITEDKMIIGQKNREKKHAIVIVQEKIEEVRMNHSNKYPELIDNKVPRDSQRCIDSKAHRDSQRHVNNKFHRNSLRQRIYHKKIKEVRIE